MIPKQFKITIKKYTAVVAIIVLLMLICCAKRRANNNFLLLADEIIHEYFKFYPVKATLLGNHEFDNQLDNWDKDHINQMINQFHEFQGRLSDIDSTLLTAENKIDYIILQQQLTSEIWELESYRSWENDGTFYNDLLKQAIIGITMHKHLSIDHQNKSLLSRLQQFPRLLQQAKRNLKNPSRLSIEKTLEQIISLKYLLTSEITTIAHQYPEKQDSLLFYNKLALDSINNYNKYLKDKVLPTATKNKPRGSNHYLQILENRYQLDLTAEEIIAKAEQQYQWCYQQIAETSTKIYQQSSHRKGSNKQFERQDIETILNKIYNDYTQNELLINYVNEIIEDMKRFIITKTLFEIPEFDTLYVERTPEWEDSFELVYLLTSGPLEEKKAHYYYLKSLPDYLNWLDQISFLRRFNKSTLQVLTMQHIFPGKSLQLLRFNLHPSIVRKIFKNKNFIAGWHFQAGFLMIDAGYGGYDLNLKLIHLLSYLHTIVSTIVDVKYHTGQLDETEAFSMLTTEGFMESDVADYILSQIKLNPAQSVSTFWGYTQIRDTYRQIRLLRGDYFSRVKFWKQFLNHGAIPLPILRKKLINEN